MFSFTQSENSDNVRGLRNLGNTCFLNSVLQALSSCPQFVSHIEFLQRQKSVGGCTNSLSILSELRGPGRGSVNPRILFSHLSRSNKEFQGNNQQDALEVFDSLINCIQEENASLCAQLRCQKMQNNLPRIGHMRGGFEAASNNAATPSSEALSNPFQGLMSSHIECQSCSSEFGPASLRWMPTRHQVFTNIPLPIPTDSSRRMRNQRGPLSGCLTGKISIYHCLDEFFEQDMLSGITCSACSLHSTIAAYKLQDNQLRNAHKTSNSDNSLKGSACSNEAYDELFHQITKSAIRQLKNMRIVGDRDSFVSDFEPAYKNLMDTTKDDMESNINLNADSRSSSEGYTTPSSPSSDCNSDTTDKESSLSISFDLHGVGNMLLSLRKLSRTDAVKRTAISRLPRLLCLYLCRRVYDEHSGKMRKLSDHIAFPTILSLAPYFSVDGSLPCTNRKSSDSLNTKSRSTGPFSMGGIMGSAMAGAGSFGKFALRAVVEHGGNADTGHYIAYCLVQKKTTRVWEMFSDEMHKQVSEEKVLAAQATMLFYERLSA